jgi:hypothetical protein
VDHAAGVEREPWQLMQFAILATGQSMSLSVARSVAHMPVVVVNDAFRLLPTATALAAQDIEWWRNNPDAMGFAGRKFTSNQIEGVECVAQVPNGASSGVLALDVAKVLGATRVMLLGFDMHGTHYFGPHPAPLVNTTPERFEVFQRQFTEWGRANPAIDVVNATPGSRLSCFPQGVWNG